MAKEKLVKKTLNVTTVNFDVWKGGVKTQEKLVISKPVTKDYVIKHYCKGFDGVVVNNISTQKVTYAMGLMEFINNEHTEILDNEDAESLENEDIETLEKGDNK